jgi:hypothetical protein
MHLYAGNLDPAASAKVNSGRVYLLFMSSSTRPFETLFLEPYTQRFL